ncbi:hypothetical protein E2C01_006232 [Portunus trituberculatus]|uniref:Uncharacterized protein n=1 Tax=Portunus trituberculatus TaxID=210409 RepID=A0A5B7CXL7_PORTR|nr:hypothetical protein [Portunus trituberculatus]
MKLSLHNIRRHDLTQKFSSVEYFLDLSFEVSPEGNESSPSTEINHVGPRTHVSWCGGDGGGGGGGVSHYALTYRDGHLFFNTPLHFFPPFSFRFRSPPSFAFLPSDAISGRQASIDKYVWTPDPAIVCVRRPRLSLTATTTSCCQRVATLAFEGLCNDLNCAACCLYTRWVLRQE